MLHLTNVSHVLLRYRLFTTVMVIMLFILLVRLPMGLFHYPSFVDTIGHFVMPAVSAPLITELLINLRCLPALSRGASLIVYVLIGTFIEVVWEILEYTVDITFDWNWQLGNTDTMIDIISAVVGGIVGGVMFLALYRHKS